MKELKQSITLRLYPRQIEVLDLYQQHRGHKSRNDAIDDAIKYMKRVLIRDEEKMQKVRAMVSGDES